MKRLVISLALMCAAVAAFADAPFTISRPADGAKVREMVRVLIPKNSVPDHGYIGYFIGGKFVEATLPPVDKSGKYYEYDLDTKAKGIPDGKLTLEAVLYQEYQQASRIIDRTSVEVTVQNTATNKLPEDGLLLRYRWTPGTQTVYNLTIRNITDIGDEKKIKLGAKPSETSDIDGEMRMMYAVDNAYSDGSGLVRMQALPEKGKDSAFLKTDQHPNGRRFADWEMHPIYEHLSGTGLEIWGAIPPAFPMEGTGGQLVLSDLFANYPLPTLPFKKVKVGSTWGSRFQFDATDMDNLHTANTEVIHIPARGELVGLEWEKGHPCAKMVNTIAVGAKPLDGTDAAKARFTGEGLELKETIWFALDRRQIVKIVRTFSQNVQVTTQNNVGQQFGPPGAPGRPGGPQMGGAGSGPGGARGSDDFLPPPPSDLQIGAGGGRKGQGPPPGVPGVPGSSGMGGQGRGGFGRQGGMGVGAPASTQFIRQTIEETFVLEE